MGFKLGEKLLAPVRILAGGEARRVRGRALDDVGEADAGSEGSIVLVASRGIAGYNHGLTEPREEALASLASVVVAGGDAHGRGVDADADRRGGTESRRVREWRLLRVRGCLLQQRPDLWKPARHAVRRQQRAELLTATQGAARACPLAAPTRSTTRAAA